MASFILELKNIRLGCAITHERNLPVLVVVSSRIREEFETAVTTIIFREEQSHTIAPREQQPSLSRISSVPQ